MWINNRADVQNLYNFDLFTWIWNGEKWINRMKQNRNMRKTTTITTTTTTRTATSIFMPVKRREKQNRIDKIVQNYVVDALRHVFSFFVFLLNYFFFFFVNHKPAYLMLINSIIMFFFSCAIRTVRLVHIVTNHQWICIVFVCVWVSEIYKESSL